MNSGRKNRLQSEYLAFRLALLYHSREPTHLLVAIQEIKEWLNEHRCQWRVDEPGGQSTGRSAISTTTIHTPIRLECAASSNRITLSFRPLTV